MEEIVLFQLAIIKKLVIALVSLTHDKIPITLIKAFIDIIRRRTMDNPLTMNIDIQGLNYQCLRFTFDILS